MINTHEIIKYLMKADFTEKQAEAIVKMIFRIILDYSVNQIDN